MTNTDAITTPIVIFTKAADAIADATVADYRPTFAAWAALDIHGRSFATVNKKFFDTYGVSLQGTLFPKGNADSQVRWLIHKGATHGFQVTQGKPGDKVTVLLRVPGTRGGNLFDTIKKSKMADLEAAAVVADESKKVGAEWWAKIATALGKPEPTDPWATALKKAQQVADFMSDEDTPAPTAAQLEEAQVIMVEQAQAIKNLIEAHNKAIEEAEAE